MTMRDLKRIAMDVGATAEQLDPWAAAGLCSRVFDSSAAALDASQASLVGP